MRIQLLSVVLVMAGAGELLAVDSPLRPGGRPNILLIISDDHSWHDAGCYGNTVVRTPNIDALAAQGMRFSHAFTGTSMCTPSRSMLYTGLYPLRNGAYPNHSEIKQTVRTLPAYFRELGYRVGLAGKIHVGPREQFPFEYMPIKQAGRFIKDSGDNSGGPFMLVVATNDPHMPWAENDGYDPAKIEVPPYLVDTIETRRALARYYTDVTNMDREVGQVVAALTEHGREADTLVIYAGDHGAQFPFAKWTLYDAGIRTPFIVRWPGVIAAGTTNDAMIHFIDVLPTLIDVAGGKPPGAIDGRSFADVLRGKTREHRKVLYGLHTTRGIIDGSDCYPIRSIRTREWKYISNLNHGEPFKNIVTEQDGLYWPSWLAAAENDRAAAHRVRLYQHRPAEELYDLRTDPFELNNLADDSAYKHVKEQFELQLGKWMASQHDRGRETEMKVPGHGSEVPASDEAAPKQEK